ncbi:AAA family ATPase [Aureimonas sp. N4]|uniref:AAA family ATPase n=1 Tax=Aureimonas sp. N4 TaxID=1638165 RepID=UPI0007816441|nr:AAA family ATPase [Aureimonas sp. N4]
MMFNDISVDEADDWRATEDSVARTASAYMREAKAFDALSDAIRAGKIFPTIAQLLDGHPPFRDDLAADIEVFVARSRQISGLPESLRDDLRDFHTWPCADGSIRIVDAVKAIDVEDFDERGLHAVWARAAWYGAIFGVPRLRRELFAPYRDTDHRRVAYRCGLELSVDSLGHASQWKAGRQSDISADGHLILRRLAVAVEVVDWMREHHQQVRLFTRGKLQRSELFALANPATTEMSAEPEPPSETPADQPLLHDVEVRLARAQRLAAEGQTGLDESGNVIDDDVRRAAEALGTKTIGELLGRPKLRVLGPLPDVGTGDQRSFAKGFSALANVGTPLVVANGVAKIAAGLVEMWPHAANVVHRILADVRDGEPVRMRPILLVGKPGCGKTSLLGSVARRLGLPSVVFPCASVSDGSFGGTPAQWHTRRASTPLQLIRSSGRANPAVILDELEKTGVSAANGSLVHALLPMLERHSAESYFETALELSVDLSAVNFLATANDLSALSDPLRDRFRIITMPDATLEHLDALVDGVTLDVLHERGTPTGFYQTLAPDEVEVVGAAWGGGSLRKLRVAVEAAIDHREASRTMQ